MRTLIAVCAALLLLQPASGQQQPPRTTGNPGNTPGIPGSPNTPGQGRDNSPRSQQQEDQRLQRPVFLSGRVLLEDGSPPPDSAIIESVCNGAPRIEAYTDTKGEFHLELGSRSSAAIQDATIGSADRGFGSFIGQSQSQQGSADLGFGLAERMLMSCDIQARLPGYTSEAISLADRRPTDNPEIGVIFLKKIGPPVEGRVISATTLAAPKNARKAFEKGLDAAKKSNTEDALKGFRNAVEIYPGYAAAWVEIARVQSERKQFDEARVSLDNAIKADPRFIPPYLVQASIQASTRQWNDLLATTGQVLRLDPYDYPQAYLFNALANYRLRDVEAAEKSAREAQRIDVRHVFPKSWQMMGIILASRQDYRGAAAQMREYLKISPQAPDADAVRAEISQLEQR